MKQQTFIILSIITLFFIAFFISEKDLLFVQTPQEKFEQAQQIFGDNNDSLDILLIGDYGTGGPEQKLCAEKFNEVAGAQNAKFILGVGDNFYEHGVTGLDDPGWNTKWADVYQTKSNLKDLTWYGVIGNHDYGGKGLYSEFQYKEHGWQIEDFFWTHTDTVQGKSIAFIHIDTSFLAYGINGEPSEPLMKSYFEQKKWTNYEQILTLIEQELIKYNDYDWKIVMGHHQIGFSCPPVGNTDKVFDLLKKYNVSAYLSGHSHQLSFSIHQNMGILLSGAGAYFYLDECQNAEPIWSKGMVIGFMHLKITQDQLQTTAYHAEGPLGIDWKTTILPTVYRQQ